MEKARLEKFIKDIQKNESGEYKATKKGVSIKLDKFKNEVYDALVEAYNEIKEAKKMSQSYSIFYDKKTGKYFRAKDDQIYKIAPGGEYADDAIAAHPDRYEEIGAYPTYRNDFNYFVSLHKQESQNA